MKTKVEYEHLLITGSSFRDNVAQIGVYFQSLNSKLTYEQPKYNVNNKFKYFYNFLELKYLYLIIIFFLGINNSNIFMYSAHKYYGLCNWRILVLVPRDIRLNDVWSSWILHGCCNSTILLLCWRWQQSRHDCIIELT